MFQQHSQVRVPGTLSPMSQLRALAHDIPGRAFVSLLRLAATVSSHHLVSRLNDISSKGTCIALPQWESCPLHYASFTDLS